MKIQFALYTLTSYDPASSYRDITFWVCWTLYFILLNFDLFSSFIHTFLCHLVVVKTQYSIKIRWQPSWPNQMWHILAIATSYNTANQEVLIWRHWDSFEDIGIIIIKWRCKCKEMVLYTGELIVLYSKINPLSPYEDIIFLKNYFLLKDNP